MTTALRAGLLLLASAWLTEPTLLPAQSPPPTTELAGRVVAAASGEPVPFTVLALVPAGGGPERTALTGVDGSFHFDSIAAGEYRLRLDRVGAAPELSPPLRVTGARPATMVVRSAPRREPLPGPGADTVCRDVSDLPPVPRVALLWRDAATAAEARRLFDRGYSVAVVRRELNWIASGPRRVRASVAEEPVTHTPDDAFLQEFRASMPESVWGQVMGAAFHLLVPDLPELFGRGFLATHCLTTAAGAGGEQRLSLVIRTPAPPGAVRVGATLVLDSTDALTRVELEYRVDGRLIARGAQQYTDAGFPGGQLRFASRLDLEEVPQLAGAPYWVTRQHYDNYRIVRDTVR